MAITILLLLLIQTLVAVYLIALIALSWVIDNGFANKAAEGIKRFLILLVDLNSFEGVFDGLICNCRILNLFEQIILLDMPIFVKESQ